MTTALSIPAGSPPAIRRAGVMWTGSPTRFRGMRCAAASAWTLVTPGITVQANETTPRSRIFSMIRSVESYRDWSPQTRNAPTPEPGSGSESAIASSSSSARASCQSRTAPW
jgi:hypothetical protein